MTWIELAPTRHARLWEDDETGQRHVSALPGAIVAYESTLDSGQFDTLVNLTAQRITAGGNDGWRIVQNGWHYFLGQPAGKATDGWVGFGGRQGANVGLGHLRAISEQWQQRRKHAGAGCRLKRRSEFYAVGG